MFSLESLLLSLALEKFVWWWWVYLYIPILVFSLSLGQAEQHSGHVATISKVLLESCVFLATLDTQQMGTKTLTYIMCRVNIAKLNWIKQQRSTQHKVQKDVLGIVFLCYFVSLKILWIFGNFVIFFYLYPFVYFCFVFVTLCATWKVQYCLKSYKLDHKVAIRY